MYGVFCHRTESQNLIGIVIGYHLVKIPDEIPKTVVKDVAVCNWVPAWDPKDSTSIV